MVHGWVNCGKWGRVGEFLWNNGEKRGKKWEKEKRLEAVKRGEKGGEKEGNLEDKWRGKVEKRSGQKGNKKGKKGLNVVERGERLGKCRKIEREKVWKE